MIKARILINDKANDGQFTKYFLVKMARMGASIMAYPESGCDNEPVDMDTNEGFLFIKNYCGNS